MEGVEGVQEDDSFKYYHLGFEGNNGCNVVSYKLQGFSPQSMAGCTLMYMMKYTVQVWCR